jgi:hypothetical protein
MLSSMEKNNSMSLQHHKRLQMVKFDGWYLDLSRSKHMANHSKWFIYFVEDKTRPDTVGFVNGEEY